MENRKQGYNPMKAVSGGAREKKQTVTITEDLKVIVNANNGVLKGGKESVHISGEFVMNAKSVSLLIAALEGKNIHIMSGYPFFDGFILGEEGAKEITNRLEAQKKRCEELEEKLFKTDDERYEVKRERNLLREKINEFNETRRPWERKLNIEMK